MDELLALAGDFEAEGARPEALFPDAHAGGGLILVRFFLSFVLALLQGVRGRGR